MFGQNPKRTPLFNDGTSLEIKNIFKTIQGEGPFIGMPAIFIRLGGCNLACTFCDTDFEEFSILMIDDILQRVDELSTNIKLVVITGGEPFRQPIELLCEKLIQLGFMVQIETNGTLYRNIHEKVCVVCSPKAGKNGYSQLPETLLPHINALKFLIADNKPEYSHVPEIGQSKHNIAVFVQPMDQNDQLLNKKNEQLAIDLSIKHGYRLSIQTHKVLGID
jgi:organic radical activating enzyme